MGNQAERNHFSKKINSNSSNVRSIDLMIKSSGGEYGAIKRKTKIKMHPYHQGKSIYLY